MTAPSHYRHPGHSLPGELYTSQQAYEKDLRAVFGTSWVFVGTEAEIPQPGDYVTVDIDNRSVIVVRDDDLTVRAFHNVCRHRGSRLIDDANGCVGTIVCPYHQWTYSTGGALVYADSTGTGFDKSSYPLRPAHVRSVSGLLFLCLAARPPADFDDFAATVTPYLAPHNLAGLRVAAQLDVVEQGNWKLVMENNRECVHCGGHPELLRSFFPIYGYGADDVSPRFRPAYERFRAAQAGFEATCDTLGLQWAAVERLDRPTGFRIQREPLDLAGESFTLDGTRACRRLLMAHEQAKLGRLTLHVQPNAWLHVMSDHAVTFSVLPTGADTTRLRTTWLVHPDAVEGIDYDRDNLTAVWRATNEQDRAFVARAQRGVASPDYVPGPYLPPEYQVDAFCTWYTDRLAAFDGR